MNEMWTNVICWIWMGGTALLATACLAAAFVASVLAAKRKRPAFLGLGAAFLFGAAVSTLANPIANLFIFQQVADRNTAALVADMQARCPIGHDAKEFVSIFGRPARTRDLGEREIWTYDANPWWMVGWTEIEIGVASNKITGHWLED